uniref:Maspardin n=2 Tax=Hemiselmis andersenii TaxID=464988 RepID=A0A6U4PX95_HEMAN|mmetsp:Transcript_24867/g.57649  ORF Transcript_24867/g.57649 Transcript_24867/m.57649 type:complete len:343 (+) Transcript_24867:254-1282(+)
MADMLNPSKISSMFNAAVGIPDRKSTLSQSEEFKSFRSSFPLKNVAVDLHEYEWRYFEGGDKKTPLLLCIPGASGTAECLFRQLTGLCPKGYRVVASQPPPYYTVNEFVVGMDAFLDHLAPTEVHIFGASLGGFLVQQYCVHRPKRVSSIILCNSFCSTESFTNGMMTPMYQFMPTLVLKNIILSSFNPDQVPVPVAEAIDFVIEQLDTMGQGDLSSRLTLNGTSGTITGLKMEEEKITLIDSLDKTARPAELREELWRRYPNAKKASVRMGGDFPFLAAPEEVNLYIEVHLRRVGVTVNLPNLEPQQGGVEGQEMTAPPPRPKDPPPKKVVKEQKPLFQDD